ncbi:MAG: CBS domain-containing protein [Phycisphaeraceae bacterium]|nr:CBS domain-containing protein [Phycisphaeraceae bacterium]
MLVRDGMTSPVMTTTPDALLPGVDDQMAERRVHQLPVVDAGGKLIGIITARDVGLAMAAGGFEKRTVESAMTTEPVTLRPSDTLEHALTLLLRERFGAMPVVDEQGRVVGIFARHDCLKVLSNVLGLEEAGSRVDVEIAKPADELAKALTTLAGHDAQIISAILSNRQGQGARTLYVRLRTIDPGPMRRKLGEAGLKVVEPGD